MERGHKRKRVNNTTVEAGEGAAVDDEDSPIHALRDRALDLCVMVSKGDEEFDELAAIAELLDIEPTEDVNRLCDAITTFFSSSLRAEEGHQDTARDVIEYDPDACALEDFRGASFASNKYVATRFEHKEPSDDIIWNCPCLKITYTFGVHPEENESNIYNALWTPTITVTKFYLSRKGYFTLKDVVGAARVYYSKPITNDERDSLLAATRNIILEVRKRDLMRRSPWGSDPVDLTTVFTVDDEQLVAYLGEESYTKLISHASKRRFNLMFDVVPGTNGILVNGY